LRALFLVRAVPWISLRCQKMLNLAAICLVLESLPRSTLSLLSMSSPSCAFIAHTFLWLGLSVILVSACSGDISQEKNRRRSHLLSYVHQLLRICLKNVHPSMQPCLMQKGCLGGLLCTRLDWYFLRYSPRWAPQKCRETLQRFQFVNFSGLPKSSNRSHGLHLSDIAYVNLKSCMHQQFHLGCIYSKPRETL
jgi:hypothetical protein